MSCSTCGSLNAAAYRGCCNHAPGYLYLSLVTLMPKCSAGGCREHTKLASGIFHPFPHFFHILSSHFQVCTDDGSGMVHLVIGTGGHVLSEVDEEQRLWCRAAATDAGFGLFRVQGEHLRMQFIRSADGQVGVVGGTFGLCSCHLPVAGGNYGAW